MLIIKLVIINIFLATSLLANKINYDKLIEIYYDKGLSKISNEYDVSKYLLLAIANVESGLNPFVLGIFTKDRKKMALVKKYLDLSNIKYINKKDSPNMSIFPKNYTEARMSYIILKHFDLKNFDIGYSQINIKNIESMNINPNRLFTDTEYVFKYSAKILTQCFNYNKQNIYKAIECYNKGINNSKYDYRYTQKVIDSYKEIKYILNKRGM